MTTTLFGGAVLIALLFFGLRLTGISNYWRGVISGALPTMAIMSYSLIHWPGADVVALHLAMYVATATVLTLTGERKKGQPLKFHWIPMIFVAFFVILAVLMASFVSISVGGLPNFVTKWALPNAAEKTVHTAFSGVVPHDEAAAKMVSQYMNKTARQRQLGWTIEVAGLEQQFKLNQPADVTVSARDGAQQPLDGATVKLIVKHPADAADTGKLAILAAFAPGRYRASVTMDRPGQWVAVLQIARGTDEVETAKEITVYGD
ncbi:MAG: FixH family protein [Sulfuricella sp.]|nr:FixH family protein [Sulfuricella sp.]